MVAAVMEASFRQSEQQLTDMSRQLDIHLLDVTRYLDDIRRVAQFHSTCSV